MKNNADSPIPNSLFKYMSFKEDHIKPIEKGKLVAVLPKLFNDPYDSFRIFCTATMDAYILEQKLATIVFANIKENFPIDSLDPKNRKITDLEFLTYFSNRKHSCRTPQRTKERRKIKEILKKIDEGCLYKEVSKDIDNILSPQPLSNTELEIAKDIYNKDNIKKIVQLRKNLNQDLYVCCLSATKPYGEKSMLLWSHYSDSHKGFCIEYDFSISNKDIFDFDINKIKQPYSKGRQISIMHSVEYVPKLPDSTKELIEYIDTYEKSRTDLKYRQKAVEKFPAYSKQIAYKAKFWNYEQEWRILTMQEEDEKENYVYLDAPKIKSIYFGANFELEDVSNEYLNRLKSYLKKKKEEGQDIKIYKMELKADEFILEARKVEL